MRYCGVLQMKKLILLVLAAVLLFSGCAAVSEKNFALSSSSAGITGELETSDTSGPNAGLIDSLINIMQLDKAKNSVAEFTCESTFEDVLDKTGEGKIETVFLTYYSELAGYPAVARYVFKNIDDDNENMVVCNPPLYFMTFDIFQDEDITCDEQLRDIINSMDAVLGENSTDEGSESCNWENESYQISINTDISETRSGTIARIMAFAPYGVDFTGLFPYAFGTDIYTVYQNETPAPLPESFTIDPYSYYLHYEDGGTAVSFFFAVRDLELKLSSASFQTDLYDIEIEDIGNCLKSFGDRMEEILGPADSRDSTHDKHPSLLMEWPGLEVRAYNFISTETYSIFIDFSEEYFIRNESV